MWHSCRFGISSWKEGLEDTHKVRYNNELSAIEAKLCIWENVVHHVPASLCPMPSHLKPPAFWSKHSCTCLNLNANKTQKLHSQLGHENVQLGRIQNVPVFLTATWLGSYFVEKIEVISKLKAKQNHDKQYCLCCGSCEFVQFIYCLLQRPDTLTSLVMLSQVTAETWVMFTKSVWISDNRWYSVTISQWYRNVKIPSRSCTESKTSTCIQRRVKRIEFQSHKVPTKDIKKKLLSKQKTHLLE